MNLESTKYKKRLIVMLVILIVAAIIANASQKIISEKATEIDETVEILQAIPSEEYAQRLEELKGSGQELYESKEDALQSIQETQETYNSIVKYPKIAQIILITLSYSGPMIAIMMYFILTGWIIQKKTPDIKKWLSIAMRVLVLIILLPLLIYAIIIVGIFGQIPFAVYTLYKYIKTKKSEEKDDVIVEK